MSKLLITNEEWIGGIREMAWEKVWSCLVHALFQSCHSHLHSLLREPRMLDLFSPVHSGDGGNIANTLKRTILASKPTTNTMVDKNRCTSVKKTSGTLKICRHIFRFARD